MKNTNKKGFTVVELVIVIAVIAVLAAVLIPTFAGIIHKADVSNDTQLVKNLNTALAADTTKNYTMTDALDAAAEFGYDVEKINASATDNEILWDSANNLFCYFNENKVEYIPNFEPEEKVEDYQYWVIDDKISDKYSTYFNGDITTLATDEDGNVVIPAGFDTSDKNTTDLSLKYTNAGAGREVVIYTNGGSLTVDAPNDVIRHYGESEVVDIVSVKPDSFHEFGKVDFINIKAGKVQLEGQAVVGAVHAEAAAKLVVVGEAKVENISETTEGSLTIQGVEKTATVKTKEEAKSENVNVVVETVEELITFLTEGTQTKAKLVADIEIKDVETYSIIRDIELDLNGYTITLNDAGSRPFEITAAVTLTVNGEREGSAVVIPVGCGSYGIFALKAEGAKLVLNGGEYNATMNNGAIVKTYAKNTLATLNNVKASTENGMVYDFDTTAAIATLEGSKLVVNGGEYLHGYAVDNRVDLATAGKRCAMVNSINSEWNNVNVVSKFNQILYTTGGGTHVVNNCTFNVISDVDTDDYINATIGVAYNASLTVNGGTYVGKYALYLYCSGHNFTNNGGEFDGRVYDYHVDTNLNDGAESQISGMDGFTKN